MGGFGSGRSGGRPTVERGLTLNLYRLLRLKTIVPGESLGGSIIWTYTRTGERVASVGYEASLTADSGRVRLYYTTKTYGGDKRDSDYWIALATTPQPFGGRRWWFQCPKTGDLVSKLYLPNGAYTFASRRGHQLGYLCQRETPRDRSLSRAFALRDKIGGEGGIGDYIPKPKGMHARTYERALERIFGAEEVVEMHSELLLDRLKRMTRAK